eukprot:6172886-Pleurochrysis_carterae.AAC.5
MSSKVVLRPWRQQSAVTHDSGQRGWTLARYQFNALSTDPVRDHERSSASRFPPLNQASLRKMARSAA